MWCCLSDVGKWQSGSTPSRGVLEYYGGTIPWLKTGDLNDGYINSVPEFITEKALEETSVKMNPAGSVLIAMYGATIGKVGILTFPATTNQACCACSDFNGVYNKYLFYFLISHKDAFIGKAGGGAQSNISKEIIVNTLIPIPPAREQERIVNAIESWLDIIDGVIAAQQGLLSWVEDCKSKVLDLAIHGKLVPQDPSEEPAIEFLKRINPAFQPSHNLHYEGNLPDGWTCGLFGELNQHRNKSEDPMSSPETEYELYSVPTYETGMPEYLHGKEIGSTKQLVKKGDVLLCKINPHLNRAWVVSHYRAELQCIASSEWIVFHSDAMIPEYARLFFVSPQFKNLMLSNVSGVGGSLMRAQPQAVKTYLILIPPIEEQKRIVKRVTSLLAILQQISDSV